MKNPYLFYTLKIWLTAAVLTILASGLLYYSMVRVVYEGFGVSYRFLFETLLQEWIIILAASLIPWLSMIKLVEIFAQSDGITLVQKKTRIFLMFALVTSTALVLLGLIQKTGYYVPGIYLWLIYMVSIALAVLVFPVREKK